jgi:hypothetical protein
MDYKKHYDLLIERAKTRQLTGYVERHHIVPRCVGGTDEKSNLVELTPEEHYVAHQLLVKMYPENDSLVYAANKMTVSSKTVKRNNKRYGWLKRRYQSVCKKRVGKKNASYGRSWYHDPVTLENGKFLLEDIPAGWVKGRVPAPVNTECTVCGKDTGGTMSKWCNKHRPKKEQTVFRSDKSKKQYTTEEKIKALIENDGSIRKALFSLGLNDSGAHYRKMKEIKASVYPHATNV